MARVIFHLDMDAFYASVEQRDRPELRGKAVIVGSSPKERGVVCAASYEARHYGVRSAMPSSTAARLCPNGIFVPPRMGAYRRESQEIQTLMRATGALIEPMSIDEAYLDLSQRISPEFPDLIGDEALAAAEKIAHDLKCGIRDQRGLTATIGIASNKLLAKIASDYQKPDGLTVIRDRDKVTFLRPLSVRAIPGIGPVTERILNEISIRTIGDLQDRGDLRSSIGSFAERLQQYALGDDDRPLELGDEVKSISAEETFRHDTADRPILRSCLREQAAEIAQRLQERRLAAHTVQVKVRYGDFTTLSRQFSLEEPIMEASDIYRLACFLLARDRLVHRPLRLLGLGVAGLRETIGEQLSLAL